MSNDHCQSAVPTPHSDGGMVREKCVRCGRWLCGAHLCLRGREIVCSASCQQDPGVLLEQVLTAKKTIEELEKQLVEARALHSRRRVELDKLL